MKKFNRVLAMLLALVMVLAVLPFSAIADAWLNVEAEKETNGNETTTNVTVTVDPKALLSYLQDGDLKGLLKGINATGGLGSIMTKEELLAILPEEQLIDLAKAIVADIDAKALIECLDVDALLACVDTAGLVALFEEIDLQDYVKDVDLLMGYIDDGAIEQAVAYINTGELINDYASELIDLALGLSAADLFNIVYLDKAVKLNGVDVQAAANLTYIQGTIGYTTLANSYVNKVALDAFVDANVDRFSATIPAYVNKGVLSGMFNGVKDQLANYMDSAAAEAIVRKAITDGVLVAGDLVEYVDGESINVDAMVADGVLVDLYDELLSGDGTNPAAIDVKVLLFGNGALAPLFPNLADLITNGVLNVEELLNNDVIVVSELITANVINVDALAAVYGYDALVNVNTVKTQITTAIGNQTLPVANIVACLKDYTAAVKAIGVNAAIAAIPGGYTTVMDYVTDFNAIIELVGVETVAIEMLKDGSITDIVDVTGLVEAVSPSAVVSKVDVKKLVQVIYNSGVLQELVGMLDFDEYLVKAFSVLTNLQKTITAIEIDGVVITERNKSGFTKFVPAELIDALENLLPTLDELANIDDSGKLFDATFALSYLDKEGVVQTKRINFSFVLTAGTDMIRAAAAKLSVLMDKIGYVGLVDGELVADITVPSEFASVLRIALEKMADSTDPEFNALKDKVLAACQATPDDFIAFAEGLTLEEVVAVLDAIDPALFGKVYNKVLASRYAEVLLAYVERVTGYDLSDNLEAQNLINTIAEIPTFEVFVEKLESVTGIEITDRLPAKVNGYLDNTVFDVIDKLADRFGYDFDMYALLKAAAASKDPFAYLYTAVVNKIENSPAIYNYVKTNALKVVNRLMATKVGATVADNCLMDFYRNNSTFVFDKDVTFDARIILEKGLKKVLGVLGNYAPSVAAKLDGYVGHALDVLIANETTVKTGFDITVHVNGLYRVDFKNDNGNVFLSTLLPTGTSISKMVDNYNGVEGFLGWVDEATGEYVTKMPAKDVVLKATFEGDEPIIPETPKYTVTIVPVDANGNVLSDLTKTVEVTEGVRLGDYLPDFEAAAKALYPALSQEDILLGYFYSHEWADESVFENAATADTTVYVVITKSELATGIVVGGLTEGVDYDFTLVDGVLTITILGKDWNALLAEKTDLTVLDFSVNKDLMATLESFVITADVANAQKVTVNKAMLAKLIDLADTIGAKTVGLSYAPATTAAQADLGEESYEFNFVLDGVATEVGTFNAGATVEIVLPFEVKDEENVKTAVKVDADKVTPEFVGNTVKFNAPHFSIVKVYYEYRVTVMGTKYAVDGIPTNQLPAITGGPLVEFKNLDGNSIDGFYAPGDEIKGTYTVSNVPTGLTYGKLLFNGAEFTGTFTMPAEPVTVTSVLTANVYNVYYFVNGENKITTPYTIFTGVTANDLTSIVPSGYENNTNGCYWFGKDALTADTLYNGNTYLFWINPAETKITVEFYDESTVFLKSYEYTVAEWSNTYFATLKQTIEADSGIVGYDWKSVTDKNLTEYDLAAFLTAALGNGNVLTFRGFKVENQFNVFINGDVTVDKDMALAGDVITVTGNKVGFTTNFKVYTTVDGTEQLVEVVVTNGTFTMPESNVIIVVTGYTPNDVTYTDKDGNDKVAPYGTVNQIVITVPAGSDLKTAMMPGGDIGKLSNAPAGLVLVSAVRTEDGSLVLTYQYTLTAPVDEAAFIAQVNGFIQTSDYGVVVYVVNGVEYATKADAMANLPKRATVVEWAELSPNVMVAILEYQTLSVWAIICIILGVLLLLALIALVYVLHVTDKIGTNLLTKICVAIVSVFFGFCMIIAKATLKILNLFGIKDEDILEPLPVEPVQDIPVVLYDPNAAPEEDVEEVLGEEAPAEETPAEETPAEETPAEEAPVEEVTDAVPVEVIDETAEETPVETTEEAPAEEAPVEATEEAPVEEAPVEATEEAPVEETPVEATEEAPVEETPVEATEEAPAEETPVEATEEAPAEEAPAQETTEEVVEEEKKDE